MLPIKTPQIWLTTKQHNIIMYSVFFNVTGHSLSNSVGQTTWSWDGPMLGVRFSINYRSRPLKAPPWCVRSLVELKSDTYCAIHYRTSNPATFLAIFVVPVKVLKVFVTIFILTKLIYLLCVYCEAYLWSFLCQWTHRNMWPLQYC